MRAVKAACDELLEWLNADDFTGSHYDPELVHPPAVWVQPRAIHSVTLGGSASLTVWLYLIVGGYETEQAMTLLDDGLDGLLELLERHGLSFAEDETPITLTAAVALTSGAAPLPAYRLTVDLEL